jgi:hypothetical protein
MNALLSKTLGQRGRIRMPVERVRHDFRHDDVVLFRVAARGDPTIPSLVIAGTP